MNRAKHSWVAVLAAGTALSGFAQGALAQAAQPTTPPVTAAAPAAADPTTTGIADIVVTARKKEEALQSVPIAVTALTGAALQQQTVLSVQDLQFHVPGFVEYPEAQGGAPDFAIRGAKQQGISGSQGGVAVYLDYIPLSSNFSIVTSTYDMQSVQVLKGPQGTLFGKNTTGGAVIFSPNKPTDRLEAYAQGEYGNYNRVDLTGMINVPITEGVALRVAGRYIHRDAYIDNVGASGNKGNYDSENNQSLRATLRIQPTGSNITSDTLFDYYHQNQNPNTDRVTGFNNATACGVYLNDCPAGVSQAYTKALALPLRKVDIGTNDNTNRGTYWGISNTTTWDLSDQFNIRNIFGYRHDKLDSAEENDGTYLPILEGTNDNHQRQITEEVDVSGKLFNNALNYTLGLYYANNKYNQISNYQIFAPYNSTIYGVFAGGGGLPQFPVFEGNGPDGPIYSNPTSPSLQLNNFGTKTKAVFGQINYNVAQDLTFTGGARYNSDKDTFTSQQYRGYTDMTETALACHILDYASASELVAPCEIARRKTFNSFTWNASLNFKPDSKTLIYVSAGRGFQAGGFNQQIREAQYREFNPEKVFNVEAGLKKDWYLGGPIRTNFAIFRASYKDQQRVENGVYSDGANFIATFNAAGSTIWGGEAEIDYLPVEHLDLSLSYSYVHAQYDNFFTPNVGAFGATPQDLSGLAIGATPKHTINGTVGYTIPTGGDGKLRASVSGYYRSGVFFNDLAQDALNHQKGYALFNARIDLTKSLPIDVGLWMNNIGNKTYGVFKFDNLNTLSYSSILLGAPRTFGIDISKKF